MKNAMTECVSPQEIGLDKGRLIRSSELLKDAVDKEWLPGFVTAVGRKGKVAFVKAYGEASVLPKKRNMCIDTVFDVASVTKVVVTTTAIMILLEQGLICLDDPVKEYIPLFKGGYKDVVSIRNLLTHTSGLKSQPEYHHDYPNREEMLSSIISTPLIFKPGFAFNYTCIGYHLLSEIVQIVSGMRIDQFIKKHLFLPLQMNDTSFIPDEPLANRAASTEYCKWRNAFIKGEVHDENCYVLGGISGNAGLFTTALDLCKYSIMLLMGGRHKEIQIISKGAIDLMWHNFTPHLTQSRGLGWAIDHQAFGDLMNGNVGHTGFTGCSICLWPQEKLFVLLMTNRVHFGRDKEWIDQIRPRYHNMVAASIID